MCYAHRCRIMQMYIVRDPLHTHSLYHGLLDIGCERSNRKTHTSLHHVADHVASDIADHVAGVRLQKLRWTLMWRGRGWEGGWGALSGGGDPAERLVGSILHSYWRGGPPRVALTHWSSCQVKPEVARCPTWTLEKEVCKRQLSQAPKSKLSWKCYEICTMEHIWALAAMIYHLKQVKGPDNPTCLCFCSRARAIAHAILQVSVRMCVGWCGLVCMRSCVLVSMCRQRCALIVARCACACACMSARVTACSSTAGLDLTTSSGDHRARAPTTWPRLWCANGRFHPALTCQSAFPATSQRRAHLVGAGSRPVLFPPLCRDHKNPARHPAGPPAGPP